MHSIRKNLYHAVGAHYIEHAVLLTRRTEFASVEEVKNAGRGVSTNALNSGTCRNKQSCCAAEASLTFAPLHPAPAAKMKFPAANDVTALYDDVIKAELAKLWL